MKNALKNADISNNIFDLYNFEPNTLISMSFNFDILKYVITELINSHKNTNNELNRLKAEFLEYKNHSNKFESSLIENKLLSNSNTEKKQNPEEDKNNTNLKAPEIGEEIKYIKEKDNSNSKIINIIDNKNNYLETEKEIHENEKEMINAPKQEKKIIENIKEEKRKDENMHESKIINNEDYNLEKNIESKNNENISNINENENKFQEGIKDIIIEQKNYDAFKQIEIIAREINNLKSKQLFLEKDFIEYKNKIDENITKKIDIYLPIVEDKLNSNIELIKKALNESIRKNIDDIKLLNKDFNKFNSEINNNFVELDSKENKNNIDLNELKITNNELMSKVNSISDSFPSYTKLNDFRQFKNDILEKTNADKKEITINIGLIQKSLNTLKNQFYDYINNLTDHNNLEMLLKKFENIQNSIYKLLEFEKEVEEREKRRVIFDPSKYVKIEAFNDFMASIHKLFDSNKKDFIEMRVNLDDFKSKSKEIGAKATLKDLKALEDDIFKKIENLKFNISEKFVDKNTLNKSTKIIEMQTKQLIEENKKSEKMDNWLLAKRSLVGHLCASCEAYLGDLNQNQNSKFIPWNKYPQKEPSEKIFKINGGISKILQMIKVKENNNNINNSYNNGPNSNRNSNSKSDRYILSDRAEREENVKKSAKTRNNYKNINLNSLSNRVNINKYSKNDDEDEINNLPMISMTMKKNNSSLNIFNSDMNNKGTNTNISVVNNLKNINKKNSNLYINSIQETDKEDLYLKKEKKIELMDDDNNNMKGPIITKVYKKH